MHTRRDDFALLVAMFVLMAGTGVVFPLLAELQQAHHLPTYGLGLIAAGPFFTGFAAQLGLARFGDRGRARALMIGGLVVGFVSLLAMAVCSTLWDFVVARSIAGLALGAFLPAARASAAGDGRTDVAYRLGRLGGAELFGLMVGPVAGAAAFSVTGLSETFVVFGASGLLATLFIAPRLPRRTVTVHVAPRAATGDLLVRRAVIAALLLVLAIEFPVGMFESMWARYLTDRGATSLFVGLSVTTFCLPFVLLAARGGRLADRIGPARAAAFGSMAAAPIIAAYGWAASPVLIAGLAVIEACFQAVAFPGARAAMVRACPVSLTATGQGLAGGAGLLATGVAALMSPMVYEAAGPAAMCATVAGVVVVFAVGALVVGRERAPAFV
jgi:MFS family permease